MQGENEVAIYGNSVLAVDLQRLVALEARVSLLLEHVAELMLCVERASARPDAGFPARALKWSV